MTRFYFALPSLTEKTAATLRITGRLQYQQQQQQHDAHSLRRDGLIVSVSNTRPQSITSTAGLKVSACRAVFSLVCHGRDMSSKHQHSFRSFIADVLNKPLHLGFLYSWFSFQFSSPQTDGHSGLYCNR